MILVNIETLEQLSNKIDTISKVYINIYFQIHLHRSLRFNEHDDRPAKALAYRENAARIRF